MNFEYLTQMGMEKIAEKEEEKEIEKLRYLANSKNAPEEVVEEAKKKLKELKEDNLEKEASAEDIYVDGLQKVAHATGIEPELLDEAIGMYTEEITKEAQIDSFINSISEEEAGEILKDAAANDEEVKEIIGKLEETQEDAELEKIASTIEGMDDEEVQSLLTEMGE